MSRINLSDTLILAATLTLSVAAICVLFFRDVVLKPKRVPAQVGDIEHIKVFATVAAVETWFAENDPEGVAFQYDVLK